MEIRVKVKPRKVYGVSRGELLSRVLSNHSWCRTGNALAHCPLFGDKKDKTVRVYNLHKINSKYRQIKYKNTNPKTGAVKGRTRTTELVRKGEWIAYVYDLDLALLRTAGLKVKQGTRNFTIEKVGKP